jgi:hypothetical protein
MSSSGSITWYEPYWSYHSRKLTITTPWMNDVSPRRFLRISIIAALTFLSSSLVLYFAFPSIFPTVFPICAIACIVFLVILPLWFSICKWIVLLPFWLSRPLVQINAEGIEYRIPGESKLQVKLEDLVSFVVDASDSRQRKVTILWRDGKKTIGIPNDLNLNVLSDLVGEKYSIRSVS